MTIEVDKIYQSAQTPVTKVVYMVSIMDIDIHNELVGILERLWIQGQGVCDDTEE